MAVSNPKHLLFIAPELGIGGAQTHLIRYANGLEERGYRVSIIAIGSADQLAGNLRPGVMRYVLRSRMRSLRLWRRIIQLIKGLSPDVIIGWSLYSNVAASILSFVYRPRRLMLVELNYPPAVRRTMGALGYVVVRALTRLLFPKADVVTANSDEAVEVLRDWAPGIRECRRVLNPLDFDEIDCLAIKPDVLPEFGKSDGEVLILGIGRILLVHKGFDILLRACQRLRDLTNWKLVIVGSGPDEAKLRSLMDATNLGSRVQLLPAVKNPFPFYNAADIVALPSRYEGFPNVLFEAMALGKATVSADCRSGPSEMTERGRFGRLVDVDDDDALARELRGLITDTAERVRLGMAAKQHVREKYSKEAVFDGLIACLEPRN